MTTQLPIRRKKNQTGFRLHVGDYSIQEDSGAMYKTPSVKENVTPKTYTQSY
jgi:hypothetical protein